MCECVCLNAVHTTVFFARKGQTSRIAMKPGALPQFAQILAFPSAQSRFPFRGITTHFRYLATVCLFLLSVLISESVPTNVCTNFVLKHSPWRERVRPPPKRLGQLLPSVTQAVGNELPGHSQPPRLCLRSGVRKLERKRTAGTQNLGHKQPMVLP